MNWASRRLPLLRDGKIEQGHILEEAVEEAADKVDKEIESLMLRMEETIAVIGHETENLEHAASRNQLIFVIAATLFGFVAAFFLTMKIVRPIRKAVDFSQVVASETYQKTLDYSGNDEVGFLADALNTMASSLKTMMTDISEGSVQLSESAGAMSETSTQMSANSEQTSGKAATVAAAARRDERKHELNCRSGGAGCYKCKYRGIGGRGNDLDD